jgi:hypothetical protein
MKKNGETYIEDLEPELDAYAKQVIDDPKFQKAMSVQELPSDEDVRRTLAAAVWHVCHGGSDQDETNINMATLIMQLYELSCWRERYGSIRHHDA